MKAKTIVLAGLLMAASMHPALPQASQESDSHHPQASTSEPQASPNTQAKSPESSTKPISGQMQDMMQMMNRMMGMMQQRTDPAMPTPSDRKDATQPSGAVPVNCPMMAAGDRPEMMQMMRHMTAMMQTMQSQMQQQVQKP